MATSNTVIEESQATTPGGNSNNSPHVEEEKSQSVSESPSPPTPNNKAAAGENESADGGGADDVNDIKNEEDDTSEETMNTISDSNDLSADGDVQNCQTDTSEELKVELPPSKGTSEELKVELPPSSGTSEELKVELPPSSGTSEEIKVELPPFSGTKVKDSSSDLKVELPPLTGATATDSKDDNETENGAKAKDTSDSESVYHIKWVNFKNQKVPIITQNENGPCPLLAIMNILLLKKRVALTQSVEFITANQVMAHLGNCVLENVPGDEAATALSRLNFEQNMQDAMAVMHKLQTGLDVNVRFTGVHDFEYTTECIIFDLLHISLYHGWLVDPQNQDEVQAVGKCSYNQLVEKIIGNKTSDKQEEVREALIAEQFLEKTASQLSYHGLCELNTQVKEDQLAVLFRNNHFTTLYRHKEAGLKYLNPTLWTVLYDKNCQATMNNDELFQLVTDQGFLTESNVVWETLSNVEGDCHFVDSEFHTYTKPEPPSIPVDSSNIPLNTDEQIDHDYLVALSLEREQQLSGEQMAWGQIDPQQAPQVSDLELAKQLQEEERRAAEQEAAVSAERQQQRGPAQPAARGGDAATANRRQRERTHGEREEKKSDCSIL